MIVFPSLCQYHDSLYYLIIMLLPIFTHFRPWPLATTFDKDLENNMTPKLESKMKDSTNAESWCFCFDIQQAVL